MSEALTFHGLDRFFARYGGEVGQLVTRAVREQRPLRSHTVSGLEERFAEAVGRPRAQAVSVRSGTDALHFALRGLGIGPGDDVIVTSFSFIASASAVRLAGARPVFVDVDPRTGLMDPDAVRRAATPATRAIVAVQLYGHLLAFDVWEQLAEELGAFLIEDAAQAFGSRRSGRLAGSLGVVSTFSFDPTKVLGGIETGGMLVTSDTSLAEAARALRYHGWDHVSRSFAGLGYNSQLSTANAAMLLWRMDREPERRERRLELVHRLEARLRDVPGVRLTPTPDDESWNAYRFTVCLGDEARRDELVDHLARSGVDARVHYRYVLPDLPMSGGGQSVSSLAAVPGARARSAATLSLPLHPELEDHEVEGLLDLVEQALVADV